MRGNNTDMTK